MKSKSIHDSCYVHHMMYSHILMYNAMSSFMHFKYLNQYNLQENKVFICLSRRS